MDGDITGLLVCVGLVLVMVAYWTFYIRYVRRNPQSEEWYGLSRCNRCRKRWRPLHLSLWHAYYGRGRCHRVGGKHKPSRVRRNGVACSARGGFRHRGYWIYGGDWGSASVAFCSPLGRGHPQSKTCSKARAQTSQKNEKERISLAAYSAAEVRVQWGRCGVWR